MIAVADKSAIHIQSIQKLFRFLLLVFNKHALLNHKRELLFCKDKTHISAANFARRARLPIVKPLGLNLRRAFIVFCVFDLIDGGLAQLVEHLPCKQGVSGSIPLTSTKSPEFCFITAFRRKSERLLSHGANRRQKPNITNSLENRKILKDKRQSSDNRFCLQN